MSSDPDEALHWAGDDPEAVPKAADASLPSGWKAVGKGSETVHTAAADHAEAPVSTADEPRAGLGSGALLALGVIGGVYLLYAVGWVIGGLNLRPLALMFIVADEMYLPWFWLAVAAPLLWFAAVWVLTRGRATWLRLLLLVVGAVLLVPWPFVMTGVVGA